MIDAHLHTWDYESEHRTWLEHGHPATRRGFPLSELEQHLVAEGAASGLVVQSLDDLPETRRLLEAACGSSGIAGVIGYLPLGDPDVVATVIAEPVSSALVGVRTIASWDPSDSSVLRSLEILADSGIALDVVGSTPEVWTRAVAVADAVPRLTVVVDHLGNPHTGSPAEWLLGLRAAAARGCVAQVSGLAGMDDDDFVRAFDAALDAFGSARLLFGSDWPICLRQGDALAPARRTRAAIETLSDDEQSEILHTTASRVYRLRPPTDQPVVEERFTAA